MKQLVKVELHTSYTLVQNNKNIFGSEDVCNCYGSIVLHLKEDYSRTFGFHITYLFSPICRIDLSAKDDAFSTKRYVHNIMLTLFKAVIAGKEHADKYWDLSTGQIKELPEEEIELSLLLYRRILSQFAECKYLLRAYGKYFITTSSVDFLSMDIINKLETNGCKNYSLEEENLLDEFLKRLSDMLNSHDKQI